MLELNIAAKPAKQTGFLKEPLVVGTTYVTTNGTLVKMLNISDYEYVGTIVVGIFLDGHHKGMMGAWWGTGMYKHSEKDPNFIYHIRSVATPTALPGDVKMNPAFEAGSIIDFVTAKELWSAGVALKYKALPGKSLSIYGTGWKDFPKKSEGLSIDMYINDLEWKVA